MSLEQDLYLYLTADADLAAIVSTRIYPVHLPEGTTLPALSYFMVDNPPDYSHDGITTLEHPRYQFDCWATSHVNVIALQDAVKAALNRFRTLGIRVTFIGSARDLSEIELKLWRRSIDAVIWNQVS
jgi:hypothetical protein